VQSSSTLLYSIGEVKKSEASSSHATALSSYEALIPVRGLPTEGAGEEPRSCAPGNRTRRQQQPINVTHPNNTQYTSRKDPDVSEPGRHSLYIPNSPPKL